MTSDPETGSDDHTSSLLQRLLERRAAAQAETNLHAVEQLSLLLAQRSGRPTRNDGDDSPALARAFAAFVETAAVRTRRDDDFFYVESQGIPDHPMMVGITAWQQQVPVPQSYSGDNAWRIPLRPTPAKRPQSTKGNFLRGAIALAVNGVPIFNPLNNRNEDAFLAGELDEFGGHCGRADDYHYHLAPVHLQKTVGPGQPIAFALDGYPIYGYEEPDGSKVVGLDKFNGHKDADGNYHYHATRKYPYLNGGFYGEVVELDGQVDPQPRAEPLRPALQPLRGAKITDFVETKPGSYRLTYEIRGKQGTVSYTLAGDGSASFVYVDPGGKTTRESYSAKRRGSQREERRPPSPPRRGEGRPPRDDRPASRRDDQKPDGASRQGTGAKRQSDLPTLKISSASVDAQGFISVDCTCDGAKQSPAVEWSNAPEGTKSFAVSLWHTAPDQEKSYWLVYNIPAEAMRIEPNSLKGGVLGMNDRRRADYDPLCSKGPGRKTYHITVYALSAELNLPADKATRGALRTAIQEITLAQGTLDFYYERKGRQ